MTQTSALYEELIGCLQKISLLGSCAGLLGWDEQTNLPSAGAEHRANQLSLLAGLKHEWATSPRIGELLSELETSDDLGAGDAPMSVTVREARRNFIRATKLPRRLVEEMSRVETLSQQAWILARKQNDFSQFLSWLKKVIQSSMPC